MAPGSGICEVVLDRDVRAPEILSVSRAYQLRRYLSIAILICIDVGSLWVAAPLASKILALGPGRTRTLATDDLAAVAVLLVGILALHSLYGVRASRHNRRRELSAALWFLPAILIGNGVGTLSRLLDSLIVWSVCLSLLIIGREAYDGCLHLVFSRDPERKRSIAVGSGAAFAAAAGSSPRSDFIGIVGEAAPSGSWQGQSGVPSLGVLADIEKIVEQVRPDELMVVDREVEARHMVDLAELCRRHRLTLKLTDLEMRFGRSGVSLIPGLEEPLFVSRGAAGGGVAWLAKRLIDVALALVLLIIAAPLLAIVALAVKLSSRGPVFYVSDRVGLGQKPFRMIKFRTMRVDAASRQAELEEQNEADGAMFKIRDDPRVTRLGRWLRATSIDELPQLFNVLRGQMSLVGPRPLPLRDNELLAPWHKRRHVVLPGLTGLWQVNGRSDASFANMIRLDMRYINTWSLGLDLVILLRTVETVLQSRGAY